MSSIHRALCGLLVLSGLVACGETPPSAPAGECTLAANACAAGFECREVLAGEWLCRPSLDAAAPDGDAESASDADTLPGDATPPGPMPLTDAAARPDDAAPPLIGDSAPPTPPARDAGAPVEGAITIAGRQLLVGGRPLHLKGVNWNPVPQGGVHPRDLDFAGFVAQDSALMANAGINVVRTYEPITDRAVLDALWARGIYVMSTVYAWGGAPVDHVVDSINATKDHPAILMWAVGNEWNYNGLYTGMPFDDARDRVREVIRRVKALDPTRPVATVYGEMPTADVIASMPEVDVWGLNVYRGLTFGDLFDVWAQRSGAPMFVGEYGADAYNAHFHGQDDGAEDQAAQAEATTTLTQELVAQSAVDGGVSLGGCVFEWADEWWKDGGGDPNVHDAGGFAPGGGPHPDQVFNEEWWGLVELDRTPRQAYRAYAEVPVPVAP